MKTLPFVARTFHRTPYMQGLRSGGRAGVEVAFVTSWGAALSRFWTCRVTCASKPYLSAAALKVRRPKDVIKCAVNLLASFGAVQLGAIREVHI